jgi:hypothetical protein
MAGWKFRSWATISSGSLKFPKYTSLQTVVAVPKLRPLGGRGFSGLALPAELWKLLEFL